MVWENTKQETLETKTVTATTTSWEFDTAVKTDGKCACSVEPTKVVVSEKAYRQVKTLCGKFPNLEWMAGIVGKVNGDGSQRIEEIVLFEQRISGATVELTDEGNFAIAKTPTIGWIHSHNTMQSFLSGTDLKTAAQTNGLSLCVNNKMEFFGVVKKKLPCGDESLKDLSFLLEVDLEEGIATQADTLILKPTYATYPANRTYYTRNYESEGFVGGDCCIFCERKVGKKFKEYGGGKTHKKCFKKYVRYDADDDDAYAEEADLIQEEIDDYFGNFCADCGQEQKICRCVDCGCDEEDKVMNADEKDYRDYYE